MVVLPFPSSSRAAWQDGPIHPPRRPVRGVRSLMCGVAGWTYPPATPLTCGFPLIKHMTHLHFTPRRKYAPTGNARDVCDGNAVISVTVMPSKYPACSSGDREGHQK